MDGITIETEPPSKAEVRKLVVVTTEVADGWYFVYAGYTKFPEMSGVLWLYDVTKILYTIPTESLAREADGLAAAISVYGLDETITECTDLGFSLSMKFKARRVTNVIDTIYLD